MLLLHFYVKTLWFFEVKILKCLSQKKKVSPFSGRPCSEMLLLYIADSFEAKARSEGYVSFSSWNQMDKLLQIKRKKNSKFRKTFGNTAAVRDHWTGHAVLSTRNIRDVDAGVTVFVLSLDWIVFSRQGEERSSLWRCLYSTVRQAARKGLCICCRLSPVTGCQLSCCFFNSFSLARNEHTLFRN